MDRSQQSEKLFSILDHVPLGLFAIDNEFNVRFWNRRLEEWTGIPRDQLLGTMLTRHFPNLAHPKYTTRIEGVFAGGPPVVFSAQLHSQIIPANLSNGEPRLQHTFVIPIQSGVDEMCYALFALQDVTDVTLRMRETRKARDRALAEIQERERVEARLRQSESELRALFAAMHNLILIVDHHGAFKKVISAGTFETMQPHDNLVGRSLAEFVATEVEGDARKMIAEALETGETRELEYSLGDHNDPLWLHTSFSPLNTKEAICIISDITERKRAQISEMELAIEREKVAVLSSFIQSASHDFRTALSVMNTSVYLMGKAQTDDQRQQRIDRLNEQISNLNTLVDSLFAIYRWDTTGDSITHSKTYLETILTNLQANYAHRVRGTPVTLNFTPVDYTQPIYVDEIELTHALGLLIDNAIQFTSSGSIVVAASKREDLIGFVVKDTGIGIHPSDQEAIFTMFYKVDKARSQQGAGLGLGLSMAQRIAQAHGGAIHVESTPGTGSTFTLTVPDAAPPHHNPGTMG